MFSLKTVASLAIAVFAQSGLVTPDPDQVSFGEISYNGSGCPEGSVAKVVSEDRTVFTLLFDQFIAFSGTGVADNYRKNCQLSVEIKYPQGWSYTIASVDYRGYVGIPAGITAVQKANYYFAGAVQEIATEAKFVGPVYEDYVNRNSVEVSQLVWSSCGGSSTANINAQVRVEGAPEILTTQSGQITVDSVDGKVKQIYGFQWKRCKPATTSAPAATATASAVAVPTALAPPPNGVTFGNLTYGGSGCTDANSVAQVFSADRTVFTLLFSQLVAVSGPGTIRENRKNCQINVEIKYPQGWSFSVVTVDYRGYVGIPEGVTAVQKATYYYSGSVNQVSSETRFVGPRYEDYNTRNLVATQKIWSACGQTALANINAQVRVEGPAVGTAPGQITTDSIDKKVKQLFGLEWRKC